MPLVSSPLSTPWPITITGALTHDMTLLALMNIEQCSKLGSHITPFLHVITGHARLQMSASKHPAELRIGRSQRPSFTLHSHSIKHQHCHCCTIPHLHASTTMNTVLHYYSTMKCLHPTALSGFHETNPREGGDRRE